MFSEHLLHSLSHVLQENNCITLLAQFEYKGFRLGLLDGACHVVQGSAL